MVLHRRRLARWLALVALLLVTFVPAVSMAVAASQGPGWQDVCSADAGTAAPGHDGAPWDHHALEHCPYCALHADLALPPPVRPAMPTRATLQATHPAAPPRAPLGATRWASAQPRAPPFPG